LKAHSENHRKIIHSSSSSEKMEEPREERPIRPAGEAVLRAFAGEDVGRDHRAGDIDSDDEDDEYTRQVSLLMCFSRPSIRDLVLPKPEVERRGKHSKIRAYYFENRGCFTRKRLYFLGLNTFSAGFRECLARCSTARTGDRWGCLCRLCG
jgi:hypothetical protein